MTKKLIPGLAAVILLAGTVLFIINKNSAANSVHDFETAFKESPFYNGKEIKQVTDKVFSEVHPDLYGFTCDDEYVYWMNADGKVACITSTQQTFPEQDKDAFTRFDAEAAAEEWFDKVFTAEEKTLGSEKRVESQDFDGGAYPVTINLTYQGIDTGNTAAISISVGGKLISGAFIYGADSKEEIDIKEAITEEQALALAKEALVKDCAERYGPEAVVKTEEAKDIKETLKLFKGQRFWEIEMMVPTEHVVDFEEHYELFCSIRIEAYTGECLGIATPLK